jgi:thiol-disulfide isomerase/thioredoxin
MHLICCLQLMTVSTQESLKYADIVGIYFSGSWCQPCKQFTPLLVTFYERMKQKNKHFEIILVSYDRTEQAFVNYFQKMPWLALTLENIPNYGNKMSELFRIEGIPTLVLLEGSDASIITLDGTAKVSTDTYGVEFPWRARRLSSFVPKPVNAFLKKKCGDVINSELVLQPTRIVKNAIELPIKGMIKILKLFKSIVENVLGSMFGRR